MDKDSQNKPTVAASAVVAIVTPLVSGANDLPPVATEDTNDTSEEPQKHFSKLKMSNMKFLRLLFKLCLMLISQFLFANPKKAIIAYILGWYTALP